MFNLNQFSKKNNLEIIHCKTILSKAIGLMFSKPDKILIFHFDKEKIHDIHMLFVFFPIDILFLDKNKRIVEINKKLMPFEFYTSKSNAKYFVEIPHKYSDNNFKMGDKIDW